jgi:hypothetical protein
MEFGLLIFTSPYYLLFGRITKRPIDDVLSAAANQDVKEKVEEWLLIKQRQAKYAQVAVRLTLTRRINYRRNN